MRSVRSGSSVEVQILPDADFAERLNADELPLFIHDWFSWGEDPFYQMTFLTQCGSFVNYARFCNEEYDALVEEGKFTLDAAMRADISSQTQEIFYDDVLSGRRCGRPTAPSSRVAVSSAWTASTRWFQGSST